MGGHCCARCRCGIAGHQQRLQSARTPHEPRDAFVVPAVCRGIARTAAAEHPHGRPAVPVAGRTARAGSCRDRHHLASLACHQPGGRSRSDRSRCRNRPLFRPPYNQCVAHTNPSDEQLKQLLTSASSVAIVGASSNPDKASYGIMKKLQSVGFNVIPINPKEAEMLGVRSYPSLGDVKEPIDIVDVFRHPEDTPAIADEAVAVGAKALWLQAGISNEEAAARARAGGLIVVMDA